MNYPWLVETRQRLCNEIQMERLGHAYLLSGPAGLGKTFLCLDFCKTLLCNNKRSSHEACSNCASCSTFESGSNPDFLYIRPEEERKQISVEQIRSLTQFYSYKSHYGRQKVAIIAPATKMNNKAGNALLKILEEPPAGSLIMLVASSAGRLLPTIRSRCQNLRVEQPDWNSMSKWLTENSKLFDSVIKNGEISLHGSPIEVLNNIDLGKVSLFDGLVTDLELLLTKNVHPLTLAKKYGTSDIGDFLNTIELVAQSIILAKVENSVSTLRLSEKSHRKVLELSVKSSSTSLFEFLDRIVENREVLLRSSGIRPYDIIEATFIALLEL